MCDMKKKDIEPIGKAKLIQEYMDINGITGRQMAKRIGIPHSTLQDWLRWNRITHEEYDRLTKEGHNHMDIYKSLRGGALADKKAIDVALKNCISKMEVFKIRPPYSKDTKLLISELKRILEVIERQVITKREE